MCSVGVAGRGHQHQNRRRSHEVRSSHLGSYVNGEAEAVDTVDLLGLASRMSNQSDMRQPPPSVLHTVGFLPRFIFKPEVSFVLFLKHIQSIVIKTLHTVT